MRFTECHSVTEALEVIAEYQPDVIFLDHFLTKDGNEGLEIVDQVRGVKFYSTTGNMTVIPEYQKRGIEWIDVSDLRKLKSLIID